MSCCWRHPSLTVIEIAWRWCFGVLTAALFYTQGRHVLAQATNNTFDLTRLGLDHLTITDPIATASRIAGALSILIPLCWPILRWLLPLLLTLWAIFSSLGRTILLRRADPSLHARPLTLIVLQLLRVLAFAGALLLWFRLLLWAAQTAIYRPLTTGAEPNVLLYFVLLILGTLVLFILWALVSWSLSIAPLLAMIHDRNPWRSLQSSVRLGPLTMKLIEINFVMGIVKAALVVLALVFSATPLPFESVATPGFLTTWWIAVTLFYILASDFFHVVRLIACLELWRFTRRAGATAAPVPASSL